MSKEHWILYDGRACGGPDSDSDGAAVLASCDSDEEARGYAGDYGDMACYFFREGDISETWQWDWTVEDGFRGGDPDPHPQCRSAP